MGARAQATPPATAGLLLRCHSCSHVVGEARRPMQLVAILHATRFGRLEPGAADELRHRCRRCGWVNVFHPLTPGRMWDSVQAK